MNTQHTKIAQLIDDASRIGDLSTLSSNLLKANDLGDVFDKALGVPADTFEANEAILMTILIDDSGSIRFAGNSDAVKDGHNLIIDALGGSKQASNVLMSTLYLNGKILMDYSLIKDATKMDSSNYNPNGMTPLYDMVFNTLHLVLAKTVDCENNGIPVRTITVVITDGHDEGSHKHTYKDVNSLLTDMLIKSEKHIVAAVGINDGTTDFNRIFQEMGIPSQWILTPANNASEIRKAFATVSQSAVRASQCSGASFSQAGAGGFGV